MVRLELWLAIGGGGCGVLLSQRGLLVGAGVERCVLALWVCVVC